MAKILERTLTPEQLASNEQLERSPSDPHKLKVEVEVDFKDYQERFKEFAKSKSAQEKQSFIESRNFSELHYLASQGLLSYEEIMELNQVDDQLKNAMLEVAKLHQDLERTQKSAQKLYQKLYQENIRLQKELEKPKK